MLSRLLRPIVCTIVLIASARSLAVVTFSVSFDKAARAEPASGRLIVLLVREGAGASAERQPIDGPFWEDPQPLFGIDVKDLAPGAEAVIDDRATSFPGPVSGLAPGKYRAQARLVINRTNSEWRRDPGNLFTSKPVTFTIDHGKSLSQVHLALDAATKPEKAREIEGVEIVEVTSKLLSEFAGHEVRLRAGVRLPLDFAKNKRYAAVYEVPGFGGDHRGVYGALRRATGAGNDTPEGRLARSAVWVVLDPESPNGHTLFANSANNGPCGDALVQELIPALEAKYNLVARPDARILRGHSSGGWSTLWLALKYPETFGACWSSSPDPVDFRRMQRSDIYAGASMYSEPDPDKPGAERETPSLRVRAKPTMTVRQENLMEEVLGPHNTSAQQWDSWLAVFGPRDAGGHPAALYDPTTGAIDHAIAERYRAYDIGELLRKSPGVLGPIFKQRIRLIVGDLDSFYLNEAVALLKADVDQLSFFQLPEGSDGYIKIVPGMDHGTILRAPEGREISAQMFNYLKDRSILPN